MKRVSITYGGVDYTVADVDLDEVKAQIAGAVSAREPFWLRVNHGEGSYRATDLLIAPGVAIAVTGVDAD